MRLFRLIIAVCLSVLLSSKALAAPTEDNSSFFLALGFGYQILDFYTHKKDSSYADEYDTGPATTLSLGLLIRNSHKVYFSFNLLDLGDYSKVTSYSNGTVKTASDLTSIIYAINYDYLISYSRDISFFTGFGVGMAHYEQYINNQDTRDTSTIDYEYGSLDSKELTASVHIGMEIKTGDAWKTSLDARYHITSDTRMFGDKEVTMHNGGKPITTKDIIGPYYDIPSVLVFSITFSRYF